MIADLDAEIERLEKKIEECNKAYYDENKSIISDYEYDLLKKRLQELRAQQPKKSAGGLFGDIVVEDKIGYKVNSRFRKINHRKRMMSLANALTLEEFYDYVDKTNRFLKTDIFPECVCELKIDGLSFSAMYHYGKLSYVATRGDGLVGEDVTQNVLQIANFPQKLEAPEVAKLETFEVRGEIYMPKAEFEKLNENLPDDKKFSNPRNAASGTLRQLDSEIVRQRNLGYYAYFIGESSARVVNSQSEALDLLRKLGFIVNEHQKIAGKVEEIVAFHEEIARIRYELDCDIDGIVVKVNSFDLQERLGNTAHDPRWAIAFKFSGITATTKLLAITNQVGRTGVITPVAELVPVNIGGIIVKRATLHNYDEVQRLDLALGDLVQVKRAGDVIPKIVCVEQQNGGEKVSAPTVCPCCGTELVSNDEYVALVCSNHKGCRSQVIDTIRHFASRKGLDINCLGKQSIALFYDLGLLKSVLDIFSLQEHREQLENLDGFGEKSIQNLFASIDECKNADFNKVLYALGIDDVGENVAKLLAGYYKDFDDLLADRALFERVQNINGLGEKVIENLKNYFNNDENLELVNKLKVILNIKQFQKTVGRFSGQSVVFTGSLQSMTRSQAKIQAEALGFKVLTAISGAATYLVYGEDAGSKLKKAQELGVKTISEEEWIKVINL